MANTVRPLRPIYRAPVGLALQCNYESDVFLAQSLPNNPWRLLDADAITAVCEFVVRSKGDYYSIPSLAAFARLTATCKLLRKLCSGVHTPFDVHDYDRTDHGEAFESVPNYNDQSFLIHRCVNSSGAKAGVRLTMRPVYPAGPLDPSVPIIDAELLVLYRRGPCIGSRLAVLIVRPHDSLTGEVAMELALDELLNALSGHSKKSVLSANLTGAGVEVFRRPGKRTANITVIADDEYFNTDVCDDDLVEDSMNSCVIDVAAYGGAVLEYVPAEGGVGTRQKWSGNVIARFGEGGNPFFAQSNFFFKRPDHLAVLFGALDASDVAALPAGPPLFTVDSPPTSTPQGASTKGAAIASGVATWAATERAARGLDDGVPPAPAPCRQFAFDGFIEFNDRLCRPNPRARKRTRGDVVSTANILSGRRSAALGADQRLHRQVHQLESDNDGLLMPGHPEYAREKALEDESNAQRALDGLDPEQFGHIWHPGDALVE
jgi:hypothetical protein